MKRPEIEIKRETRRDGMTHPETRNRTVPPGPRTFLSRLLRSAWGCLLAALVFILLSPSGAATAIRANPYVVILNSYHPGFAWSDAEQAGFLERLREVYPDLTPPIEYLDAKRYPDPKSTARMKELLLYKHRGRLADLVVCLDNPALDLNLRYGKEMFVNVPIVFAGISHPETATLTGERPVTGVVEVADLKGTLKAALTLHPNARRILAVNDHTLSGEASRRDLEELAPSFHQRLEFEYIPPVTFQEAQSMIASLPEDSLVLIMSFATDREGNTMSLAESTQLLTSTAKVPVYGIHETRLGHGIVGGYLLGGREHGRRAGDLAVRILAGEDPEKVPIDLRSTARPMFDHNLLERFHIPLEALPAGSFVLNKPVSILDTHREFVLSLCAVVIVLSGMVVFLILAIRRRRIVEEQLRKSEARYRVLSENSGDVIWTMDTGTYAFTYMSPSVIRMLGYTPAEMMSMSLEEILAPGSYQYALETLPHLIAAFSSGVPAVCIQTHSLDQFRKNGSIVPTEVVATPLLDENGRVFEILGVTRDVTERKRAESALLEREAKLQGIFRTAPVGIALSVHRIFLEVNDTLCRMTGFSREELLGQSSHMLYVTDAEYEEAAHDALNRIEKYGTVTIEIRWVRKDGTIREISLTYTAIDATDLSRGIIFAALDITERKRWEEALRKSQNLLEEAQRLTHLGSWEMNLQTRQAMWSDEVFRIFGLKPREFSPTFDDLLVRMHPEDREAVIAHFDECLKEKSYRPHDYRIITQDASVRWVHTSGTVDCDAAGVPVGIVGTLHDITEQRHIEETLRENEERLRLALTAANQGLYDMNLLTGESLVSPEYATMLGYDPAGFRETTVRWIDHVHPDDRERTLENFRAYVRGEIPHYSIEFRRSTRTGDWKWILSLGKIVEWDAAGTPLRMLGTHTDITERKLAEEKIRQLNEELEDRVRMRTTQLEAANKELEAFAYSVSHDLRAPLRAIDGFTQILVEDYSGVLDEEGNRICSVVVNETRRMGRLIDDLLAFSRLSRAEMNSSSVDMTDLVHSVFGELIDPGEQAHPEFHSSSLHPAMGDPNLLRQVWVNLLSNAIKFSSRRTQAVIEVGSKKENGENTYWVRDNGAGFDMRYAHKLFCVFHRLHSEKEFAGTGVGLAIVQRVIRRHGGRVWAEGEVDKGATFYFSLPSSGEPS